MVCFGFTCKQKEKSVVSEIKSCEETIIEQDSIFGIIRNHASEENSLSKSISNYLAALKSLDYSNCSEQFYNAFYSHIAAWDSLTKVTDNYPDLRGELHDLFKDIEQTKDSTAFTAYLNAIWSTWSDVESQIKTQ